MQIRNIFKKCKKLEAENRGSFIYVDPNLGSAEDILINKEDVSVKERECYIFVKEYVTGDLIMTFEVA